MRVEDTELSVRAVSQLKKAGVTTLSELQKLDLSEFRRKNRGVGARTVREIREYLSYYGSRAVRESQMERAEAITAWALARPGLMLGLMRGDLDVRVARPATEEIIASLHPENYDV